jgi:hypothetical protein
MATHPVLPSPPLVRLQQQLHRKQAELEKLKAEPKAASADWSAHLSSVKDGLHDLVISESLYLEYRAVPTAQQSVHQFVACRVYELLRVERGHRDAAVVECEGLRTQLVRAESEQERLRMEKEQLIRNKRARESELTDELRLIDVSYGAHTSP